MKRNTINFAIDAASALVMGGMIATGLVIRFVLPPGTGGRWQVWGGGRHDWGAVHFWLAVAAGAVVVLHVALHWQWVCVTVLRWVPSRGEGKGPPTALRRNVAGVGVLALLAGVLGGFVWAAKGGVKEVSGGGRGPGHGGGGGRVAAVEHAEEEEATHGAGRSSVRGSMSLGEVADACGISVDTARERLGLPAAVSADARMGRLASEYGFSMPEARERLAGSRGGGRRVGR